MPCINQNFGSRVTMPARLPAGQHFKYLTPLSASTADTCFESKSAHAAVGQPPYRKGLNAAAANSRVTPTVYGSPTPCVGRKSEVAT